MGSNKCKVRRSLNIDLDYHLRRRYFREARQVSDWLIREAFAFRQEHGNWGREEIKHCAAVQNAVTTAINAKSPTIEIGEESLGFLQRILESWAGYNMATFAVWWGPLLEEIEAVLAGQPASEARSATPSSTGDAGETSDLPDWITIVSEAAFHDPEASAIYNEVQKVLGTAPEKNLLDLALRKVVHGSFNATVTLGKLLELKQQGESRAPRQASAVVDQASALKKKRERNPSEKAQRLIGALAKDANLHGASDQELAAAAGLTRTSIRHLMKRLREGKDGESGRRIVEVHDTARARRIVAQHQTPDTRSRQTRSRSRDDADREALGHFNDADSKRKRRR